MGRAAQTHRNECRRWVWLKGRARNPMVGWIGAVRPSRRPLSRPPQDEELPQCHQSLTLILRSAQRARLNSCPASQLNLSYKDTTG